MLFTVFPSGRERITGWVKLTSVVRRNREIQPDRKDALPNEPASTSALPSIYLKNSSPTSVDGARVNPALHETPADRVSSTKRKPTEDRGCPDRAGARPNAHRLARGASGGPSDPRPAAFYADVLASRRFREGSVTGQALLGGVTDRTGIALGTHCVINSHRGPALSQRVLSFPRSFGPPPGSTVPAGPPRNQEPGLERTGTAADRPDLLASRGTEGVPAGASLGRSIPVARDVCRSTTCRSMGRSPRGEGPRIWVVEPNAREPPPDRNPRNPEPDAERPRQREQVEHHDDETGEDHRRK